MRFVSCLNESMFFTFVWMSPILIFEVLLFLAVILKGKGIFFVSPRLDTMWYSLYVYLTLVFLLWGMNMCCNSYMKWLLGTTTITFKRIKSLLWLFNIGFHLLALLLNLGLHVTLSVNWQMDYHAVMLLFFFQIVYIEALQLHCVKWNDFINYFNWSKKLATDEICMEELDRKPIGDVDFDKLVQKRIEENEIFWSFGSPPYHFKLINYSSI